MAVNDNSISLNKFISSTGRCSRREADRLILAGRVTLNGKPTKPGNRVRSNDRVEVDGEIIGSQGTPETLYLAFNKPVGIVCTTDQSESKNIIKYIGHHERLFPIGRLDKDSEGLIFLTNDGDIVNKILRAGNAHEKEYVVTIRPRITPSFLGAMRKGVPILGTKTKECRVEKIDDYTFRIFLIQGLNRQIRRMCEHLGYQVSNLRRTRIMHVQLGKMKIGQWRNLTKVEMAEMHDALATSRKTEPAKRSGKKSSKHRRNQ